MSDETPDAEPPSEGETAGQADAGRMVIAERYEEKAFMQSNWPG